MIFQKDRSVEHKVKFGPMKCYYCPKVFVPKQMMGSISIEEQARCEEELIKHMDEHYYKAVGNR